MSSFIVTDKTISRICTSLAIGQDTISLTRLGRRLLKMNIRATGQRYPDKPYLDEQQAKKAINTFNYDPAYCNKYQELKSLQCYLYQCSEGTIPQTKLYRELRKHETELINAIISSIPEYDKAEWD